MKIIDAHAHMININVAKGWIDRISEEERERFKHEFTDKTPEEHKKVWLETMMAEELRLFPDEYEHPLKSALTVGFASVVGSFIPLLSFFFTTGTTAMISAVVVSALFLFVGGSIKAKLTIGDWKKSGAEMLLIGMAAAVVGFMIGKLLGAAP